MSPFSEIMGNQKDGSLVLVGYLFFCPGCKNFHSIRIRNYDYVPDGPIWQFDGDMNNPTVSPPLLVYEVGNHTPRCHSFIRQGNIEFLADCTHNLKGQTVRLPDWQG